MRRFFIFLIAGLHTVGLTAASRADPAQRECSDVSELATVNYDDSLGISIFSDRSQKICVFQVTLPPSQAPSAFPQSKTFTALKILAAMTNKQSPATNELYSDLQNQFVSAISEALLEPVLASLQSSMGAKRLRVAIESPEGQKLIQTCATDLYEDGSPYDDRLGFISCGHVDDRTFAIQASVEGTTSGLWLPAY